MGKCIYCGESAGLLSKCHPECKEKYEEGQTQIEQLALSAIQSGSDLESLAQQAEEISQQSWAPLKESLVTAWEEAVRSFLDDDIISQEEEGRLARFANHFDLSQATLNVNGTYTLLAQNAALRDVLEGKVPDRMAVSGQLPFNFQKSEQLVWVFPGVSYLERRTKRKYVGGHHGASIRVAKGVYYRVGAFRGEPVDTTEMVEVAIGILGITTKHLYFASDAKSFRIRYDKIVSFEPFDDGIGVQRDATTAKPQIFVTGDGWFIYNLVSNLAQM